MITSCLATAGYVAKLPALKDRTFEFGSGLTILFGQNASGKSSLLKLLATYSGCLHPGWTTFSDHYFADRLLEKTPDYPHRLAARGKNKALADVAWDGTPSFYSTGPAAMGQASFEDALEAGGDDADMFFGRMFGAPSAGQDQLVWLRAMEKKLRTPPDYLKPSPTFHVRGYGAMQASGVNDTWGDAMEEFVAHLRSLPRTGRVTVLLDEPDAHMSLPISTHSGAATCQGLRRAIRWSWPRTAPLR